MIHITCSFRLIPPICYALCLVNGMLIRTFAFTLCTFAALMTLGGGEAIDLSVAETVTTRIEENRMMKSC